jgi:outer membrane protein assembly factor BamB
MTRRAFFLLPTMASLALTMVMTFGPAARGDDWPQWLGPRRDGVWREEGILERFPPGGPKVVWRTPIGSGYTGPAVAGDRVYVMDRVLRQGTKNPDSGFSPPGRRNVVAGSERVLCLDDATGRIVWTHEYECEYRIDYPAGPRATPVVADGKVYALGAMGQLCCLDAATGKVLWGKDLVKDCGADVQTWGFAAHPLLDGERLITLVGGEGGVVYAFHKDTGRELWKSLSSRAAGYCPPVIHQVGATRQLIVWHPEAVCGLDPESGKPLWEAPFVVRAPNLTISTPAYQDGRLFVTSFYNGAMMLKLSTDRPGAEVLWKGKVDSERPDRTDTLNSIMPTPVLKDGHVYGVCSYGELRCLNADTGARVWMSMEATRAKEGGRMVPSTPGPDLKSERWSNAFLVPHGDRYFLFNEKGDLIIARLSPRGYEEVDRAKVIDPDNRMPGRPVVWSHPAFAHRRVYVRNDHEIVCVSLEK